MAKGNLREEHTFNACQRVIDKSLPLTARNVRDELGGGSFTTLVPLLNKFRQKLNSESSSRVNLPPLPQEIENFAKKMLNDLWAKFHLNTESEKKDIEAKYERRLAHLQVELSDAREEVAGHSAEIEKLEEQLQVAESELEKTRRSLAEKDGQVKLIMKQLSERDEELKALLERAARAEGKLNTPSKNQKEMSHT
jgi:chromosome segregation ATPase